MLKIYTFSPNRPDFVKIQLASFHKYLNEEFEYTVFNNALYHYDPGQNQESFDAINQVCHEQGVNVVSIEKDRDLIEYCLTFEKQLFNSHGNYCTPNVAHAYALNWGWKHFISKESQICLLDNDMFLMRSIRLTDLFLNYPLYFLAQSKPGFEKIYMWPGFVLADLTRLPEVKQVNWMCGQYQGIPLDVGGWTFKYLEDFHPILCHISSNNFPSDQECDYQKLKLEDEYTLLHYRAGSDWEHRGTDFHFKKTEWLKKELGI